MVEWGIELMPSNFQNDSQSSWPGWGFLTYGYYPLLIKPFIYELYLIQIPEKINYTRLIISVKLTLSLICLTILGRQ